MSILLIFPVKKEIISFILDQKYSTIREKCCAFMTIIISAFEKTNRGNMRENSEKKQSSSARAVLFSPCSLDNGDTTEELRHSGRGYRR